MDKEQETRIRRATEYVAALLEWLPEYSYGSSGWQRKERVRESVQDMWNLIGPEPES